MDDMPVFDDSLDIPAEPPLDDIPVADIPETPDVADTPEVDTDDLATVHAGNEIETEPSPEGEPETVSTTINPPEGWTPGGPESGG